MDPWEAYKKDKTKSTGGKSGSETQSRNPWEQYQTEHGSGKITKTPTQPLFGGGYQSFQDREKQTQSLIPGAAAFTLQRQQDWMERSGLPANTVGRSYVDKSNEAQAKLLEITARANREAAANRDAYGTARTYADNLKVQANLLQNAREAQIRNQLNRRDPAFAMAQDYDREQLKWYKQAADQAVRLAEAKVKKDQEWISQLDAGDDRYTEARKALQQSQKALREAQARERSVYQAAETRYQAEQFQARTAMENAAREDRLFQTLQAEPEELRKEFEDKNSLIHYMTEEEKSIYRYYWNRDRSAEQYGGSGSLKPDQAQEYKKSLWNELEYRKDTEQAKEWYLPQKGDGILLKGLKLLQYTTDSLFSGGERAMYGIDAALSGSPTPFQTEKDTRLGYAAALAGNGLGGNLYRQWGGAMQSTGQMLPAMLMGNFAAGAMAMMPASVLAAAESATGGLASARNIAKLAQDATFFLSIKGNAYTEALQKGLTPEQAQSYSILSALSEVGLQRAIGGIAQFGGISERQLATKVNQIDNILLRNAAHYGLNVAGEIGEEWTQNFMDPLFVTILTGDKYQAPTGMEMLDTFVSTLMMVSVNNVGDTIDYNRQSRIRQNLQELARQARSQGGDEYLRVAQNIENWIREVDADPANRAYTREDLLGATNMMQIAEDLQAENPAQGPVSQPAATNQAGAIQAENNTQGPVSQPAAAQTEAPVTAPAETPDVWQNGQGRAQVDPQTAQILRQSAAQEAVSLSDSELQREILDARREASGTNQAAAIARIREQELTRSLEQRRAERGLGVNAPGLGRQGAETTTNEVQQNQKAAATAAAGTGGTYGTAEGFNDGGQRNGRLGAGGEAGGLGGSPEGQVAGGPGQAAEAGTANQGQTVELEAVSARRIGVLGGTDNRTLRVVPQEMESRDMQMIRQEVEAKGQKVVFFRGQIERRIRGTGQIRHPNAIYQTAADGSSTYYLRADLRSRNVRQLYEHEAFHDVVRNNQTLWRDMADYLYANYSQEEIDAMVDRYVEAYDGIYGTEDMDRYLEEIFADAYAGIQRGRIGTDAAAKTIREYSQDIEDARRNSQTAQATQQTRGSPDQRFSITDVQGQNQNYPDCVVLDTDLFRGVKPRDWGRVLQRYVYSNLAGQEITLFDENWYTEKVVIARYADRTRKDGAKNSHRVIDDLARNAGDNIKNLAVAHLPELLVVSTYESRTGDNNHQWLDQNGWTYRKAYICDKNGKIYEATLNIAEGRDRRILYDISNIREIDRRTAGGVVPSTAGGRGSLTSHSSSGSIVTTQNNSVKHFSSDQSLERINADYLRAVKNGDMQTAQRMVDEAAEAAMPSSKMRHKNGKLRKVFHGTNTGDFTVFNPDYIGMSSGDDGFFGMGFYFAYSKEEASYYGNNRVISAYLDIQNPFNFEKEIYSYKGEKAEAGYAPRAVAIINFADKFPSIAKNIPIYTKNGKISAEEFARELKDVIDNKQFSYQKIEDAYSNQPMTLATADPQEYSYESNGETHKWMDYGYQRRFVGKPNALDVAVDYLMEQLGISSLPSPTQTILDNNRAFTKAIKDRGYDGVIQSEDGDEAVVFSSAQIKSADPVTYDENGEVIPLSERFRTDRTGEDAWKNEDIRFSEEEEEEPDNGLGVSGPGLGRAEQGSRDFDTMAVQKKRDLAEKATVQALRNRIARNEADLQGLEQLRQQGQWNAVMEERARDMRQSLEIDREALAKKQTASGGDLRARIERQETEIRALELARKSGAWNENAAKRLEALRARNQADKDALREDRKQSRQTREQPKVETQEPRIARQELREGLLDLFHVPAGKNRAEIGKIINKFADDALESGSVSAMDRRDLVRRLYEVGVEFLPAEEYYKNIRNFVKKGRIYVSEEVRQDFGDDWAAFRGRAWGNGIYLTNNQTDAGVDVWNQELAEAFPGSFDADATDMRQMLEAIVELAEEGKGEKVSLAEMMARNQRQTGESVDQQMDQLERKVDQMIDTFAQKARLERTVREQGALRRIRERQDNREKMERSRQRKQENELRSQVMKDIQKLNRMRKKTAPEIQAQIRDTIGNIDTVARSISAAGLEDLQALARAYVEMKDREGTNFLGNPYVEDRLLRLQKTQLDDLDISQVTELGRTVCALVKSIQDNNKLLADQRHREISQAATAFSQEIQASRGSKSALANWTAVEHLSPTRFIQRLGGWLRGGEAERLSRTLEDGQTRKLEYQRQATRIFDKFLDDKKNRKWMQKAHGKQAEWIKVKVPVTDSQGQTSWREIEITPMMRVSLMMHAQNLDNLRHIETGGIRIPEKAAYLKGKMEEAFEYGEQIKMRPETVRAIVKDATAQERAFAGYLKQYFDVFSKEKINEVSMLLDGFERAGGNNYYHIKTDQDFLAKPPETVQQNLSLESIGSIVNERQHAGNPIVLEDATTALTEHIEQISKYYGFAVPIRDFNAVMNYTFHEEENAFADSVKKTLGGKWGPKAKKYLDRLMADLQQRNSLQDTASSFLSKLRGNLAGASLRFNAAVAMSQAASLPGAAQSVGFDGVLAALGQFGNLKRRISMDLIERYSPLLWYRNQGNSTQELGDYMKEQSLEAKLPLLFGMIQKVDSGTIKLLWYAAEHRVNRDTDLKPGTQAEIDAGTDPYYQEVARVFQRAVYDTQPNYTEMQRPHILRSPSDLTKALTMYKTVPLQYYNMMYEAAGRLMMDGERAKADPSKQNKAALKASRKFFANTFVGVLTANVVYVAMKALVKGLTFRDKKYRDEEGELTPEAAAKQLGLDLAETYAGSLIGGSELWWAAEKLMDSLLHGKYSNTNSDGIEITALSAMEDTVDTVVKLGKALNNQDLHGGLGAIKEAAAQLATNSGLPARNMETYLKAIVKWINPEWAQRYDNVFNETDKPDLADERGRYLNAAIRVLMDNRAKDVEDRTVDELQRLWEAGQRGQIPTPVPKSFTRTVNGESETVDLDAKQKQTYRETWNRTVSRALDRLTRDKAYQKASDKDKAAMIQKLYAFAGQAAKKSVLRDYEPDKWVQIGLDAGKMGVRADEYISFYTQLSKITSKDDDGETINGLKNSRGLELLGKMGWSDKQAEAVYLGAMASESLTEKEQIMVKAGMTWKQAAEVLGVVGNNWDHAEQIVKTKASDKAKLKALSLYLGDADYRAASAGVVFRVDLQLWTAAKKAADAAGNGNGSVNQDEATAYLDSRKDLDLETKAYLWQMLCTSSKYKNNPYSTTMGASCWEYMQTVSKP